MKPCTACNHYNEGHVCGLTGNKTEESRAFKADLDDCWKGLDGKRLMPAGVTRNQFEEMVKEEL